MAEAGWSVLGIDSRLVGGECPYFGCIPSKMVIRGAAVLGESARVNVLPAGTAQTAADYRPVGKRIRDEATDNWDDRVAVERFEGLGGPSFGAWGASPAERTTARCGSRSRAPLITRRMSLSRSVRLPPSRPLKGWPSCAAKADRTRRSGRIATSCKRSKRLRRWSSSAAVLSALSSPRGSRGTAPASPLSRRPTG